MTTYNPIIFGTNGSYLQVNGDGNVAWSNSANVGIDLAYMEWQDICKLAETNPAVNSALEKLRTVYYLSKDDGIQT